MGMYLIPHPAGTSKAPKQFVDLQNDVTASGIELACREASSRLNTSSVTPRWALVLTRVSRQTSTA